MTHSNIIYLYEMGLFYFDETPMRKLHNMNIVKEEFWVRRVLKWVRELNLGPDISFYNFPPLIDMISIIRHLFNVIFFYLCMLYTQTHTNIRRYGVRCELNCQVTDCKTALYHVNTFNVSIKLWYVLAIRHTWTYGMLKASEN